MAHRPGLRRRPTALPVAKADIATFDDIKALVVERFDRRWAEDRSLIIRLPQEDMCQALGVPPALKYECDGGPGIERIMELLFGSSEGLADRRTFMATQVVFWLLGAIDGHAKNFSIFLLPGGGFRLTPAYDIISAYPLVPNSNKTKTISGWRWPSEEGIGTIIGQLHRHWLGTAHAWGPSSATFWIGWTG